MLFQGLEKTPTSFCARLFLSHLPDPALHTSSFRLSTDSTLSFSVSGTRQKTRNISLYWSVQISGIVLICEAQNRDYRAAVDISGLLVAEECGHSFLPSAYKWSGLSVCLLIYCSRYEIYFWMQCVLYAYESVVLCFVFLCIRCFLCPACLWIHCSLYPISVHCSLYLISVHCSLYLISVHCVSLIH